jgi:hypothetical protein
LFFNMVALILTLLSFWPNSTIFLIVRLLQGIVAGLFSAIVPLINK